MANIFWTGYCSDERTAAISHLQRIILKYGHVVDFKFFSDIATTIVIEASECNVDQLKDQLAAYIMIEDHECLNSNSQKERTIYLNITFSQGKGNLAIETPNVPG